MSPVRGAGLVAALAAVILPHSGETFGPIARSDSAHWYSWSPSANSYLAPNSSASWLQLTTNAGTQTTPDDEPADTGVGTQTDGASQTSSGGASSSSSSQVDAAGQTDDSAQQGQQDQGSGSDDGAASQQPTPGDGRAPPHPVIVELSDRLRERNRNPAVYYGDVDGIQQDSDGPPSPPPYQGPPPYSQPTDMGEQEGSQGGQASPDDGSQQQPQQPGPPADSSAAASQWSGEDSGASDSTQTQTVDMSTGTQGQDDGSYDSSPQQQPSQDGQGYGPPPPSPPPPTGGDEQPDASGGDGDEPPPPNVPTDPKELVAFFNNARKEESEQRVNESLSLEEKIEDYLRTPDGDELLSCIKLKPTSPTRFKIASYCDVFEKRSRDACIGQAMAALGVLKDLGEKCHERRLFDCLKEVVLPLSHPLFTVFDETSQFGITSYANEWFRAFYSGKKNDKAVPDFDRIFNLGEASNLFYGSVLDERDGLRSTLKKKSESKFSRKRVKEAAVRQYAMSGLVAIAAPPHLDDVMIKAIIDQLDFEDCAAISKVSIKDGKGKTKKIDVKDLRYRALAKALSQAIRAPPNAQDPVSSHNRQVLVNYVGSFDQYGAAAKLIQHQTAAIPVRHDAPPEIIEGLVRYLQEKTEAVIYGCLKLGETTQGGLVRFVKKNKLLRSAIIGYMSLLLKLGIGPLRKAAREFKGSFTDPSISLLPPIPVSADALSWVEGARVQARQTLFMRDAKAAKFDSALCIEVMRHSLGSVTAKEQKALDKAQKKMDKEEKKKQKKSGGKGGGFFSRFRRKRGGGDGGDDDDSPSGGGGLTADGQPLDKKAEKARKKEEKKKAKEEKKQQKKAAKEEKKQQKKAEKEAKKEEKKQQKKAEKEEKKKQKKADKEAKKEEKKRQKQAKKEAKKLQKQKEKDLKKLQKKQEKDLEKQQKKQQKDLEKQQKKQQKDFEKQQKEREKEDKKKQKEEEKQRKKDEKEGKKDEKRGGGAAGGRRPQTQFLQVTSIASSPSLLAIKPHNPWALANPEASSVSFLQTKTRISQRTKTLIGVSIALVGAAGFIAAVVLQFPIAALVILLAISMAEFYLFFF
ncbi:hypothetical protein Emed_000591 [Eimeria media]